MRVVIDANVLVSGVFWSGAPSQILRLWRGGRIELLASAGIVAEYEEVLHEIAVDRGRPDLAQRWTQLLAEHLTLIDAVPQLHVCRDPDDDLYLDCAVQGGADRVVSGDKDLLSLGSIGHISICTARQLIDELE